VTIESLKQKGVRVDGDCYRVAADFVIDSKFLQSKSTGNDRVFLVHGMVTGQGPINGLRYDHAWVEVGGEVIDRSNGKNIHLSQTLYYAFGRISEEDLRRYSCKETAKNLLLHKHYGPWK